MHEYLPEEFAKAVRVALDKGTDLRGKRVGDIWPAPKATKKGPAVVDPYAEDRELRWPERTEQEERALEAAEEDRAARSEYDMEGEVELEGLPAPAATEVCAHCGEERSPDQFEDGLRCKLCVEEEEDMMADDEVVGDRVAWGYFASAGASACREEAREACEALRGGSASIVAGGRETGELGIIGLFEAVEVERIGSRLTHAFTQLRGPRA